MLDHVRDFHGRLAQYYSQLSDKAAQERVKLVLDHISSHEKNLQKGLGAYGDDASRQVMDTWADCRHCEEILKTCEQAPIVPEMTVDGVTRVAMDVDRCLLSFYREVAGNAESESVREVFRSLIDMEEAELRKLAFGASQAMDV
jgi:rubrerythrin